MGWGKEWPVATEKTDKGWIVPKPDSATAINQIWQNAQAIAHEKLKLTDDVIITKTTIENGEIKVEIIPPEEMYTNLKPTHDPYTNPGAMVYYQCGCGAILDPKTKSFAALNNAAMNKGWKVRWNANGTGYQPFCVKCGEGVE